MPDTTLNAEVGRSTGTSNAKRLRRTGRIPAVVYGHGMDALSVSVDARELRSVFHTDAGLNALLNLRLSDGGEHLALAKEIQRHPVRNTVVHVDFIVVSAEEEVVSDVPITVLGEAIEVRREGGIISNALTSLSVRSKATNIPSHLEIDISEMQVGDTIRVSDLKLPEGVTTEVDPEEPVVIAQSQAAVATDLPEEGEEAAEGEGAEGEGAEGEAGSEGGEGADAQAGSGDGESSGSGDQG
jgi:large subunit ribosomal protein L25